MTNNSKTSSPLEKFPSMSWGLRRTGKTFAMVIVFLLLNLSLLYSQTSSGADGDLNVTSEYIMNEVRTTVTGVNALGQNSLQVNSTTGFSSGDEILIISMQDSATDLSVNVAGLFEMNHISSISNNTFVLDSTLQHDYNTDRGQKHQVIRVPNYKNVIVENGGIITASAWDGETGGIVVFRADTVLVDSGGIIDVSGKGYRGGIKVDRGGHFAGYTGESIVPSSQKFNNHNNFGGGGSGYGSCGEASGSGGYGTVGGNPTGSPCSGNMSNHGEPGNAYGNAFLTRIYLGSGGGGGNRDDSNSDFSNGQNGGGIIYFTSRIVHINGEIKSKGFDAVVDAQNSSDDAIGGSGSGGSIYISAEIFTNSDSISAEGGRRAFINQPNIFSGSGGDGRIRIDSDSLNNLGSIIPGVSIILCKPHFTVSLS
jgi:hypothetical protein